MYFISNRFHSCFIFFLFGFSQRVQVNVRRPILEFILKFNTRHQEPDTTQHQIMRLRSGTQYTFVNEQDEDSDVVFDEGMEIPAPMNDEAANNINTMMRPYPIGTPIPNPLPVPIPIRNPVPRKRRSNSGSRFRVIFNRTVWFVQSLPGIFATIAGIHAIVEIIHPPEHRIEISVLTQTWWQLW